MKKFAKGFGLVEIMVALVLGLVVVLGIIQIFLASKNTYVTQNSSARMQEDARFVLSKLIQEIRMTGMYGCLKLDTTVVAPAIVAPAALTNPILWDNTTKIMTLVTADIGTSGGAPTWTVVSDCRTTSSLYLGAKTVAGQTSFPLRQLIYTFNGTQLMMQLAGGTSAVLVDNVKAFSVSFGMVGSPMSYTSALTAASSADVRSVRLTLTLTDPSNRVKDQTYNVVAALRNRF
jgi:type IV pilus assembly protein PilW